MVICWNFYEYFLQCTRGKGYIVEVYYCLSTEIGNIAFTLLGEKYDV